MKFRTYLLEFNLGMAYVEHIDQETPIYANPSTSELVKLKRQFGDEIRIIVDNKRKNVYIGSVETFHSYIYKNIINSTKDVNDILSILETEVKKGSVLLLTGKIKEGKIFVTIHDKDISHPSDWGRLTKKQLYTDWSWAYRYIINLEDFLNKYMPKFRSTKN